jgi:hypothetical protein
MNRWLARGLVRLYPRGWRERYEAEFVALLESEPDGAGMVLDVVCSALGEWVAPTEVSMAGESRLGMICMRAPWAAFGVAPVVVLAAAYAVAGFILWSGWQMFLPGAAGPFVKVQGIAGAYFFVGRNLYVWGPVLVGWVVAWMAARLRVKAWWPLAGLLLVALLGAAVQVRVSRPSLSEPGHVGMVLASVNPMYALVVLALTVVPYAGARWWMERVSMAGGQR